MAYELNAETVGKVIDALQDEPAESNTCIGYFRTLAGDFYEVLVVIRHTEDKGLKERDDIYVID